MSLYMFIYVLVIKMPATPYKLSPRRVKHSPFPTMQAAKDALDRYHRGESIGFTYVSSLKAMGVIPRSNGKYELGSKYSTLSTQL